MVVIFTIFGDRMGTQSGLIAGFESLTFGVELTRPSKVDLRLCLHCCRQFVYGWPSILTQDFSRLLLRNHGVMILCLRLFSST